MKKTLPFLLAIFFLAACSNSGTDKSGTDTAVSPSTPAVENVNGNIPDSTSSSPVGDKPLPIDSSKVKDSAH